MDSPELTSLLVQAGMDLAVLFGSVAAGKDGPTSDVDIGIIPATHARFDIHAELRLAVAIEELVGRDVDLVRLDEASSLLRFEASHGRPLFEARSGAFADFVARALLEHDDLQPILLRCAEGMYRRLGVAQ